MSNLAKKKSKIWKHFTILNKERAKCEYCLKVISYSGGGTGNLTRHMRKLHSTVSIEQLNPIQIWPRGEAIPQLITEPIATESDSLNILPSTSGLTTFKSERVSSPPNYPSQVHVELSIDHFAKATKPLSMSRSKQLDEQIVKFIVKGFHSFSLVEEEEFKKMYAMILPGYTLPTRKTISSSLIPKLYQSVKETVSLSISEADAICLTTDGWTSINNVNYLTITAHYINQNDELKSFLLGCIQFDQRHTADDLSDFLLNEASNWGIENKITGIVTENVANIVSAVHLTTWRHFPCFAHTVNLVVQDSLKTIKQQLDKVKAIVEYFNNSSSASSRLQNMQAQMELPPLKLKQSVVTKWNSTYDMLERLLKIKDAVVSTLAIEQPRLNTLTPVDWMLISKCIEVLKIFYEVTVEMSAENSVSISKVIVLVTMMKMHVAKHLTVDGPNQFLQLVQSLSDQLIDRFRDIQGNVLAAEASFLDPRFKKHAFTSGEKYAQCLKSIKTKLRNMYLQDDNLPLHDPEPTTNNESKYQIPSLWTEFDKVVEVELVSENPSAANIIELDQYLNEPMIKRTEDPLKWWKDRRLIYPHLYTLMKRSLCITATSVPCDRFFSEKAGMTVTDRRSFLEPEKISQILFLNHNFE